MNVSGAGCRNAYDAPASITQALRNVRGFEISIPFILPGDFGLRCSKQMLNRLQSNLVIQTTFHTLTITRSEYRSASPMKIDLLSQSYNPSGGKNRGVVLK